MDGSRFLILLAAASGASCVFSSSAAPGAARAADAPASSAAGYNRDRSASFPDAPPPMTFDGATGKNIRWKARLPNWSNSGPLVVGRLPVTPADGASAERQQAEEHRRKDWRWLGGGTPWAEGDRLYIRGYDFLWCIGGK